MYINGRLLLSAFVLSLSTYTVAGEDELNMLKQKAAVDKATAYQYALQIRPQMESDPSFDYLYGALALSQKKYGEAQFALERVVMMQPSNMQARLALAKTYEALGDVSNAHKQYEIVKSSNPPAYVMRDINQSLRGMTAAGEKEATLNSYVEMMMGYDNNANSSTDSSTVNLAVFGVTPLDSNSKQQYSNFVESTVGTDYYKPLDESNGLELRGRISDRSNFNAHDFDNNLYRGSASLTHQMGDDLYRGTVVVQNNRISDSDFQEYYSASVDWLRQGNQGMDYFAGLFINRLHYPDDEALDVNQYILHMGIQKQQADFVHTAGIMLGDEHALHASTGEHNAKTFESVYYDVRYDVNYKNELHARLYVQDSNYKANEPALTGTRDDITQGYTLGWKYQISEPLSWKTETGYMRDDSDVSYYTYDRSYVKTGFKYAF
jgi:tetratricopeptide (TPR) repeat protein